MKVIFMGTPNFSVPSLQYLIDNHDVIAVVTQPDKPVGRKKILTASPVKELALKYDIPIFQPQKLRLSDELDELLNMPTDLLVTAAYGQILPENILNHPKFGAINVHASLLPKYRGGAPIHRAIINGDNKTGITIMYMVKELDAGDILLQESIDISLQDNVLTLHERLSELGAIMLGKTLSDLSNIVPQKQNKEEVTFAFNIKPEDEIINWDKSAIEIERQIRGLNPWPGAYTFFDKERFKIWNSIVSEVVLEEEPGTLLIKDNKLIVATGSGCLELLEVQPFGKKRMTYSNFVNGSSLKDKINFC